MDPRAPAFPAAFVLAALVLVTLPSCHDSNNHAAQGGSSATLTATVTGRVLGRDNQPLAGARVVIESDPVETRTSEDGYFQIDVAAGAHRLITTVNDESLGELCFTVTEGADIDIGAISPRTPTFCDSPEGCAGDQDCDGLPDADEAEGWEVTIRLADGTVEHRSVASDSGVFDTDADGLSDGEEFGARIDPGREDTDGDLLSDQAEVNVYKSNPTMIDTDGDSLPRSESPTGAPTPDPNLWDGYEILWSRTSPTLSDTDGDGMTDYHEINIGGTNPRVADLPQLQIELHGDPLIEVEVDYQTGTSSHSEELAREEHEKVQTDSESTKLSVENTVQLHTETKAGTSTWPPSFKAKLTTDSKFHHGYFHDTSSSWTDKSVQESQEKYETWEKQLVSFDDGKLSAAMKLTNLSDLSFKVKDLRLIAYRLRGGGKFALIGTMIANEREWPEGGHILGPGGEFTMTAQVEHIGAEMMRALVRNPTAIVFEVGAYALFQLDDWGVEETLNYAKLGEAVVQRTGTIVIDFGDGRVDRYMVATNVARNPDGSGRGVTLGEALGDILGLDYETALAVDKDGKPASRVLHRIENKQSYDECDVRSEAYDPGEDCEKLNKRGLWLVGGEERAFDDGPQVDFDAIVLHNGERVSLVFNEDSDGDAIFDREEYLLGTDRLVPDTDGDELSGYQESKDGWQVAVAGATPYQVFSDPRFADLDGDFLSDLTESFAGTDPYVKDTDGDGQDDTTDPFPLAPPCLDGAKLSLVAWWDGSSIGSGAPYSAKDIWTSDLGGIGSHGVMHGDNPGTPANDLVISIDGDAIFRLNPGPDQGDQYIDVPSAAKDGLSPTREFTVSGRIYREAVATGKPWAAVFSKGPWETATYALLIDPSGKLKFSIDRNVHEKCWGWFFGWVDGLCSDSDYNVREELLAETPIPEKEFVDVVVTFGGETMRIYVDGTVRAEKRTTSSWTSGNLKHEITTNHLVTNGDPLRLGGDFVPPVGGSAPPRWPFRGLLDDVRVFARSLNAEEIRQLRGIGVCQPVSP